MGNTIAPFSSKPTTFALASTVYNDVVRILSTHATSSTLDVEYEVYSVTGSPEVVSPEGVALMQNYPNPASGITDFRLQITEGQSIYMTVAGPDFKPTTTQAGSPAVGWQAFLRAA